MRKKGCITKLIVPSAIAIMIIGAVSSVVGPVQTFTEKCKAFFSFGMSDSMTEQISQVREYGNKLLENIGLVEEDLKELPFSDEVILKAIEYDLSGGNLAYAGGYNVFYQEKRTEQYTVNETETVDTTFYHKDGKKFPNKGSLAYFGCDNILSVDEEAMDLPILEKYWCGGHTVSTEITNPVTYDEVNIYAHYFNIKSSDYLSGYDIPWNVMLALAVVQKYAYNGTLELDDYTEGGEGFQYQLTEKGIRKIHSMFSTDEGVNHKVKCSYFGYSKAQEDLKRKIDLGVVANDEAIKAYSGDAVVNLSEEQVLKEGTYYYESTESKHPSLLTVVTEIDSYIWHYEFNYDFTNPGIPRFISGTRTSRVAYFRNTLMENGFDEDASDLLIPLVESMPNGEVTARTLEFLFNYYDDYGVEYSEELSEGIVYRSPEIGCGYLYTE